MSKKLTLTVLFCVINLNSASFWLDPDTGLNLFEYLAKYKQNYQNISITTEDKYIINTVRLFGKTYPSKGAVLIAHGIFSNPQDFLILGQNSLVLMLVNRGFDVFLMANRGCTYSTRHEYFSSNSVEYWDFSFHEIGIYDISANMDMITKVTGYKTMHVITHSQGSTALLALLADLPEYQEKIISGHVLSPVVYFERCSFIWVNVLKYFVNEISYLAKALQLNTGVLTFHPVYTQIGILLCHKNSPIIDLCVSALGMCGNNPAQLNTSLITTIISNSPAGGSIKSLIHYLQLAKSNKFQHYDYGFKNLQIYRRFRPPVYDLNSIKARLLIWFGSNDCLSGAKDFRRVASEIPTAIAKEVDDPLWNHIDFLMAEDARKNVYDFIVNYLCED